MNISYDDIKTYVSNCDDIEKSALAIKFYNISKNYKEQKEKVNLINIESAINRISEVYEKEKQKSTYLRANYIFMKNLYNNFQIDDTEKIDTLLLMITIMEGLLDLKISFQVYTKKYLEGIINKNGKMKRL